MKKHFFTCFILLVSFCSINGQQWSGTGPIWTNYNVGIGINQPDGNLHIKGSSTTSELILQTTGTLSAESKLSFRTGYSALGTSGAQISGVKNSDNGLMSIYFRTTDGQFNLTDRMIISCGGNVGIGTNNPRAFLDVYNTTPNLLKTVFARLAEGDNTGDGTLLGVSSYNSQPVNTKSFAIEHKYFGQINSSINFFRGSASTDGYLTFNTNNNTERMRIDNKGYVGIGMDQPDGNLHIKGSASTSELILQTTGTQASESKISFRTGYSALGTSGAQISGVKNSDNGLMSIYFRTTDGQFNLTDRMVISNWGNIGIGTSQPDGNLHIKGSASTSELILQTTGTQATESKISFRTGYAALGSSGAQISGVKNADNGLVSIYFRTIDGQFNLKDRMIIGSSGNVGIGTTNPQNTLDVNGTIHAKEVKVDLIGWSDFVFTPTYNLKSLSEVEKYIKANNHLPEIPSASDVAKNGVNVGEMQSKLLQKIEELTLYIIEKDKEIVSLKVEKDKQLADLVQQIKELRELITKK